MTTITHQDRGAQQDTATADDAYREGYVLWPYLGAESIFFYPPESAKEHLVIEHSIPSVTMHWRAKGCYNHQGDHSKQLGVRTGAVGDLLAVAHQHPDAT